MSVSRRMGLPYLALLAVSCCGYSTRSLLPGHLHDVHVRIFTNSTYKPGLDEASTTAMITAFQTGSGLRIVDESQADLVIEGSVADFSRDPYTYTGALNVTQYKVSVKLHVRAVDQVKNAVYYEGDVIEWAVYSDDENAAIQEAVTKAAQSVVNNILTHW